MAFPQKMTFNEQTWKQTNTGGLSAPQNIGFPNDMMSKPTGRLTMPRVITNQDPGNDDKPLTTEKFCLALPDDSQLRIQEGDLAFIAHPTKNLNEDKYCIMAVWNLNYYLERAARQKYFARQMRLAKGAEDATDTTPTNELGMRAKRFKMADGKDPSSDDIPTDVRQFMDWVFYMGGIKSTMFKKGSRTGEFGIALKKRFKTDNIFYPDDAGHTIGTGDTAYLVVKPCDVSQNGGFVGLEGRIEGSIIPGLKPLQVKGMWNYGCNEPIHCSTKWPEPPAPGDADYMAEKEIEQVYCHVDLNTGLVDPTRPDEIPVDMTVHRAKSITAEVYGQGYIILLGQVKRKEKDPSPADIDSAIRSFAGWANLSRYAGIELYLDPLGLNTIV
jgi:hypothetical protein